MFSAFGGFFKTENIFPPSVNTVSVMYFACYILYVRKKMRKQSTSSAQTILQMTKNKSFAGTKYGSEPSARNFLSYLFHTGSVSISVISTRRNMKTIWTTIKKNSKAPFPSAPYGPWWTSMYTTVRAHLTWKALRNGAG